MVRLIKLPDGTNSHMIGIWYDVTKRKHSEKELAKHRQYLEELLHVHTAKLSKNNKEIKQEITKRKQAEDILKNALRKSQQHEKEVSAFLKEAKFVRKYRDFNETARSIYDMCKNLIGSTATYITLLSKSGTEHEVLFLDSEGITCAVDLFLPMPVHGLHAKAYQSQKTVYDNDFKNSGWKKFMPAGHALLDNVMFAALVIKGTAVGLLGIANKTGGFTQNDAKLATAFAEIVAIALHHNQTMESLQSSEERYRSLVDNINLGIALIDVDYNIVMTNAATGKEFFGKDVNEIVGRKCFREFEKRQKVCSHCPGTRAMATGLSQEAETEGVLDDGSRFSVLIKAFPTFGPDGVATGFIEVVENITERRLSEKELKIRNQISEIFLTIPDEEMYTEVLKVIQSAMESKYGVFGYIDQDNGSLVTPTKTNVWNECEMSEKDIVFPWDKWSGIWGRALKEKKSLYSNEPFNVPQGHITNAMVVPVIHHDELIGMIMISNKDKGYNEKDLSFLKTIAAHIAPVLHARLDRDRKEKEIIRERDRAQSYLDIAGMMFVVLNADQTVSLINGRGCEILGYENTDAGCNEVIGKNWFDNFIPERNRDQVKSVFAQLMAGDIESVEYYENPVLIKNGQERIILWNNSLLKNNEGKITGILRSGEDITERTLAEKRRKEILYNIGERMKELTCMYGVGELVRKRKTLEEVFLDTVNLIPPGWQYPEITCGRICFEGNEYTSDNFKETEWKQASDIMVNNERKGTVEIYCLEEMPQIDEGPFMKEERNLINGISRTLSEAIEHEHAKENLQKALTEVEKLKDRFQAENIYLQDEIKLEHNFEKIIGNSKGFKNILSQVEQVAPTGSTVLILGKTGTGKELIARAIHNISDRKDRPLVKVDCAALAPNLIESELFGHEKGAFTGAHNLKIGRFELAEGGTIFLDEIGELPLELQKKLLRVLQDEEFVRLGSSDTIKVDIRVIAATNRNLKEAMDAGYFRQDLYYRLNVFPIVVPPLGDRKDDIPLLVNHFVKKYCLKQRKKIEKIPVNAVNLLQAYHWPGNIRELENIIERAVVLTNGSTLQLDELLDNHSNILQKNDSFSLKKTERFLIIKSLEESNWVIKGKRGAAARLDIPPSTLRNRIKKYGIKKPLKSHQEPLNNFCNL